MFAEMKTTIKDHVIRDLMKLYGEALLKRMSAEKAEDKFNEINKIERLL